MRTPKKITETMSGMHKNTYDLVRLLAACEGKTPDVKQYDLLMARAVILAYMRLNWEQSIDTKEGNCHDFRKNLEGLRYSWERNANDPNKRLKISCKVFEVYALSTPTMLQRLKADLVTWAYEVACEYLDQLTGGADSH